MSITHRAMLANLQICQWSGRKLDRNETKVVNARHGLNIEAARVNKNLLPNSEELTKVHQLTSAIRKDFAKRTLPWGVDGVNIMKAEAYIDFTTVVRSWEADFETAVDRFINAYPTYQHQAQLALGGLYDPADYPDVSELRDRFSFNVRFMPVPDQQDWRVDVGDDALEDLKAKLTRDIQATLNTAMSEAWRRVHEVVSRTHERLADPQNIFRDSLVENAVELCNLLPSLNVGDDPALEEARQAIERSICQHTPATLRDDLTVRADVANEMDAILKKMAGAFAPS